MHVPHLHHDISHATTRTYLKVCLQLRLYTQLLRAEHTSGLHTHTNHQYRRHASITYRFSETIH